MQFSRFNRRALAADGDVEGVVNHEHEDEEGLVEVGCSFIG